jgi:hypothetical protein
MPVQTRVPTGTVAVAWDGSPEASDLHLNVDEGCDTPDDDTSYCEDVGVSTAQQAYTFLAFALGASVSAINFVRTQSIGKHIVGGAIGHGLRVGSTNYVSSNVTQTTSYASYTNDWLTNPDTGLDWVQADVEGTGANPIVNMRWRAGAGSGQTVRQTACDISCDYDVAGGTEIATGRADETDSALAPAVLKLLAAGVAAETDAALAPALVKRLAPAIAAELDTALAPALHRALAPGAATESDLGLALAWQKRLAPGLAAETDTAVALSFEGQSLEPPGSVRVQRLGAAAVEVARTGIGAVRVKRLGPASVTVSRN